MATQFPQAPRESPFVAVEVDLVDGNDNLATLRLSNRGTVTRTVSGVLYVYDPRLTGLPILLGTSINVSEYGQPVRAQPNGGTIEFLIDATIWPLFEDPPAYHWIGRIFRVYEGSAG